MKKIVLLGSTGSVGKNVIEIVRRHKEIFELIAISAYNNIDLLASQAREFSPNTVITGNKDLYGNLKSKCSGIKEIFAGEDAISEVASLDEADIIFIAISGTAALGPLVNAVRAGKKVAIASKEPIVSAGEIINDMAIKSGAILLPVDSEHSAIMQCLGKCKKEEIDTIYLTGSGGPLWKVPSHKFDSLTIEDVLTHPKWDMGPKITVDSATMMNKGLEIIEARWLFDVDPDKIKVVVHPEAIIHSMVGFVDGTVLAAMSDTDMKYPILKALGYPDIIKSDLARVDFYNIGGIHFHMPDNEKFPSIELARQALNVGGTCPAVLNGANESAVHLFLAGKINFVDIIETVKEVVKSHNPVKKASLDEIIEAQSWARKEVYTHCRQPL